MAYMTEDGKGPYPCYAGEYCGNYLPGIPPLRRNDQTQQDAERQERLWLASMRFGRPHSRKQSTSAQMAAQGWVGLYLKEDYEHPSFVGHFVLVDTPDELREPALEN